MGFSGPAALNELSIYPAMDLLGVEFREDCFRKVVKLGRHFLQKMREAQK
jgi:hypothetical protein